MRIISGKYRGRRIQPPKGLPTRPTMDQAKEALFNILDHRIDLSGISVLDCFSGTGNISYEFISRGASTVIAIERHAKAAHFIRSNFEQMEGGDWKVVKMPVERYLQSCKDSFDVVFMDPPYDYANKERLISLVFEGNLLKDHGFLVLEHRNTDHFEGTKFWVESRNYGTSCFTFFQNSPL